MLDLRTITIKYKYKLDNENIKNIVKGTPGLTISNGLRKLGTQYGIQEFRNRSVLVLKGWRPCRPIELAIRTLY